MKTLAIFVAAVAVLAGAQDADECECGMFITNRYDVIEVHSLPPFDIDNCQNVDKCKKKCANEYNTYTNGGDLNYVHESGYTVGQEMCIILMTQYDMDYVQYETVFGYARLCKGPWDYDGESSINDLCCENGHYNPCS